jgi:type II secretory pathway pseudopilin PulG
MGPKEALQEPAVRTSHLPPRGSWSRRIVAQAKAPSPHPSRPSAGFTLIEMVGVLAVIMILAALVFSVTVRQLDALEARKEDAALARFGRAFEESVQRHRAIPGPTNWIPTVALELGAQHAFVSQNARQNARVLWIDPRLQVGGNGQGLPYQQTMAGSRVTNVAGVVIAPTFPRLLLLSSLGPPFPNDVVVGGAVAANFDAVWNGANDTVPGVGPWGTWGGLGRDLRVCRIHLGPFFVRLMLNNYASTGLGQYSIDWQGTNSVPNGDGGVHAFFIRRTTLGLLTETSALELQQILTRDCNFVYNAGSWRGTIFTPPPITPPVMEYMAELFFRSPRNQNAGGPPDTPATILDRMEAYMAAYHNWAALGTWPKSASDPFYATVKSTQSAMIGSLNNLINSATEGQCY